MPWRETSIDEWGKSVGLNMPEIREKHRLIKHIIKIRKEKKISQTQLAKKIGVTQGRIAQIESRMKTSKVTFDILFGILRKLGYEFRIITKRVA